MNTVTIKKSHFAFILVAIVGLIGVVITQYLRAPPLLLSPNAVNFVRSLSEDNSVGAAVIGKDATLKVYAFDLTPVESCGKSAKTEIPAGCRSGLGTHLRQNLVSIDVYESQNPLEPRILLRTDEPDHYPLYDHCPNPFGC